MDFNQSVNQAVSNVVSNFIQKISEEYNIDKQELESVWNGNKLTKKVSNTDQKNEPEVAKNSNNKKLNLDNLQNCNVPELKALCKERGLKCSGKKSDLLSRLLNGGVDSSKEVTVPKKPSTKTGSKTKTIDTKNVIEKLKANASNTLQIRRNAFGNYQHPDSALVFNEQSKVYGVQNDNGEVDPLTEDSIDLCNKYNLEYVIPDNLDQGADNDKVEIDEIDDKSIADSDDGDTTAKAVETDEDDISEAELLLDDNDEDEIALEEDEDEDEDDF